MIRRFLNKIESIYYYRYFSKVNSGATDTLLKKIYKSTDIQFIEKVFQLDFFREIIEPVEYNFIIKKNILVLAPHQDDELLGLGGTLLKLKAIGASITLVFLTDGASLINPIEIKKKRSQEARKVAKELKADIIEIDIPNDSMKIEKSHLNHLIAILNSREWDDIFSIWPIDNPPKHRICALLFHKALEKIVNPKFKIFLYSVHTEIIPNVYVDISQERFKKQELISLYKTQLNSQAYHHLANAKDAWSSRFLPVSKDEKYIEVFFRTKKDDYKKLIDIYGNVNIKELFKGNDACIRCYDLIKKL